MQFEQRFKQLFETQYQSLRARLLGMVNRSGWASLDQDVDDCIQEAFMLLWERREALGAHPNLPGWLTVTAANRLKNRMSREATRTKHGGASLDARDEDGEPLLQVAADDWREREREKTRELLERLRLHISEDAYAFLVDYYDKSISPEQAANKYRATEAAMRARAKRLLDKMKHGMFNAIITIVVSLFELLNK